MEPSIHPGLEIFPNETRLGARVPDWWLDRYFEPVERFAAQLYQDAKMEIDSHVEFPSTRSRAPVAEMWVLYEVFRIANLRDSNCPTIKGLWPLLEGVASVKRVEPSDVIWLQRRLKDFRLYASSQPLARMVDLLRTARLKISLDRKLRRETTRMQPEPGPSSTR